MKELEQLLAELIATAKTAHTYKQTQNEKLRHIVEHYELIKKPERG